MPPPPPTLPRCYRHPDREAGRSCTRCGKPACADCLVQATVGSNCLDCVKAARPDIKTRVRYANAKVFTPVTYVLIAANVLIFFWMLSGSTEERRVAWSLNRSWLHVSDDWYTIVSSAFVHFNVVHLLFNMVLLFQLGMLLERALGSAKFGLLYLASLLGGSLGVLLLDGTRIGVTGGASGAVFGLLGAAAVGMHRRGINIFASGIGMTLLLNVVFTFSISGVSIGGHMGGLVAGSICGWFMLAPTWRPQQQWIPWAVPAGVAMIALAGCVWAATALPISPLLTNYVG